MRPHLFGGVGVVADLSVRVQTKHLRCVGEGQRLDVLCKIVRQGLSTNTEKAKCKNLWGLSVKRHLEQVNFSS